MFLSLSKDQGYSRIGWDNPSGGQTKRKKKQKEGLWLMTLRNWGVGTSKSGAVFSEASRASPEPEPEPRSIAFWVGFEPCQALGFLFDRHCFIAH